MMRYFVQRQHESREYHAYFQGKVMQARSEIAARQYAIADAVKAGAAGRRARLLATAGNANA
jgi:hypothetical protein